ncbi:glycerophosphoryl diester phosphodiesterase [Streptomyces misionensis]|uniref:Glycerophosphoryl diester phosphodiesterase n=1 Tax=Streptomyces misionensis TaxID=67331 RepID=A0A1H5BUG8_9ACTN|nr:glycerophosphoryl diester phosphodiesterase [Streptomyces misionensis]SFY52484.1 putative glycerophosphoryl diester phosphodiesterase 1 [Streptomyces sp. F-1]
MSAKHRARRSPQGVRVLAVAGVVAVIGGGVWHFSARPSDDKPSLAGLPRVVLDAHRGGTGDVREASISGSRTLVKTGKIDVLDVDTQELADGTPVIMHDRTVERTTDGSGLVSSYTLARWKKLRIDVGTGPENEHPPTAEEYLDALGGQAVLTIEAKNADSVPRLAKMIKDRRLQKSVLINTDQPAVAKKIHRLGILTHLWRNHVQFAHEDPKKFAPYVDVLDLAYDCGDDRIQTATHAGIPRVWTHTVDTAQLRDRMLKLGVGGIITDYPLTLDSH